MTSLDTSLLLKHMQVPFVPTLGAVHPLALKASVEEALSVAHTNSFLPYDKDRRWYPEKKETILIEHIYQDNKQTIIPTLTKGNKQRIKYYCYSLQSPCNNILQNLEKSISKTFPKASKQILHFSKNKNQKYNSILLLGKIEDLDIKPQQEIYFLNELSISTAQTLANLAKDEDNSGFAFLWERFKGNKHDGDILVSVKDGIINGAIGPLKVTKDAAGGITRFPPYFGVATSARKLGVGTALWHAGLSWAKDKGAEYILIQAQYNSPAEEFYKKMGLDDLGGVIKS